jgi:hypothetical protein
MKLCVSLIRLAFGSPKATIAVVNAWGQAAATSLCPLISTSSSMLPKIKELNLYGPILR